MAEKLGLLNRKEGNFVPTEQFKHSQLPEERQATAQEQEPKAKRDQAFANQMGSIKISLATKNELNALKTLTKTKYDYEMIQTLIDSYTNTLTQQQLKRFKLLVETMTE